MKKRKYLVFIVFLMILSINNVYADTCYYQSGDISLEYNSASRNFTIRQREDKDKILFAGEPLINAGSDKVDGHTGKTIKGVDASICPAYVVYRRYNGFWIFDSDGIWGFNTSSEAETFRQESIQSDNNLSAWPSGITNITKEEFEANIERNVTNYSQKYSVGGIYQEGTDNDGNNILKCSELFDQSIIDLINDVLKYPRFIVPIIVIVLGTLDFFKAVIAGKEDEMKKAQKTFIKRVIIGVLVFLVPVLINAIMWLANIAWEGLGYSTCNL